MPGPRGVVVAAAELHAVLRQALEPLGFELACYQRVTEWPFLAEVRANRCWRTDRCGADLLVVDDRSDPFMSGLELLRHQVAQRCRCVGLAGSKVVVSDLPPQAGLEAFPHVTRRALLAGEYEGLAMAATLVALSRPRDEGALRGPQHRLFIRCPYTQEIVAADSLMRLRSRWSRLGHEMSEKEARTLRDQCWCDEQGQPSLGPPPEERNRLRYTT